MDVILLDEVLVDLANLPVRERVAMDNTLGNVCLHAAQLGFPHSSQIKGQGHGFSGIVASDRALTVASHLQAVWSGHHRRDGHLARSDAQQAWS